MNRRTFLTTSVGSLAATGLAQAEESSPELKKPQVRVPADAPNILWICTDQQRWDTIAALGNPHIRTPHLDALATEGAAFTHAYCQNPICTPSRASFLTGNYPRSIDACTNGNEKWEDEAPLVTKLLAVAGIRCRSAPRSPVSTESRSSFPLPGSLGGIGLR